MAAITEEVNLSLAELPLVFIGSLAKHVENFYSENLNNYSLIPLKKYRKGNIILLTLCH